MTVGQLIDELEKFNRSSKVGAICGRKLYFGLKHKIELVDSVAVWEGETGQERPVIVYK